MPLEKKKKKKKATKWMNEAKTMKVQKNINRTPEAEKKKRSFKKKQKKKVKKNVMKTEKCEKKQKEKIRVEMTVGEIRKGSKWRRRRKK